MNNFQQKLLASYAQQSLIKSIQQVTITIPINQTSATATITSVNTSYAHPIHGGDYNNDSGTPSGNIDTAGVQLTSATVVTATRASSSATFTVTTQCTIVEWQPWAIQSLQSGTVTLTAATSNTATLSSVTTANAVPFYTGHTTTNAGANPAVVEGYVQVTSATQLTGTRNTGTANMTLYYTVLEFKSGVLNSAIQQFTATIPSGSASATPAITSVNTSYTMLSWCNWTASSTSWASQEPGVRLSASNQLTVTRTANSATTCTVAGSVVEFSPQFIKSVQRTTFLKLTGQSTANLTITAVNTNKAFLSYLGVTTNSANTADLIMATTYLTNSTTATVTAGASTTLSTSIEVIEPW